MEPKRSPHKVCDEPQKTAKAEPRKVLTAKHSSGRLPPSPPSNSSIADASLSRAFELEAKLSQSESKLAQSEARRKEQDVKLKGLAKDAQMAQRELHAFAEREMVERQQLLPRSDRERELERRVDQLEDQLRAAQLDALQPAAIPITKGREADSWKKRAEVPARAIARGGGV